SDHPARLRINQARLERRIYRRPGLAETRHSRGFLRGDRGTAYYNRSARSFSARALVFLVQPDRIYFCRPVFCLDHEFEFGDRAVRALRSATLLFAFAYRP